MYIYTSLTSHTTYIKIYQNKLRLHDLLLITFKVITYFITHTYGHGCWGFF